MKITKARLIEIIKEETTYLAEEDNINIQRVTDIDQMVKNFLTTASMPNGGRGGESREEFFKNNINKIVQYIINGEIYHYFIPDGLFVNAEDKEVEDDSIWAKMAPMFDKFDAAGSSGMKPPVPQMPKLKNITIHSSGEHAVLRMDGFQGRSKDEIKNYLMDLYIYPDKIGDGVVAFEQGKRSFREFFMDLKDIDDNWSYRDENGALEEQKIKLTKTRLMEIVKEELAEVLNPKDGAGAYVKDFKKSKAPQFKGKSDKKKREMAVAAYLQDKEEAELKEKKDYQIIKEGWKDWLLATVIGATSIFGAHPQAQAAPLDNIELSASALDRGESPTALKKRIIRSKRKRAAILGKHFDKLMASDFFKPLKGYADKSHFVKERLWAILMDAETTRDINKAKDELRLSLAQEQQRQQLIHGDKK